MVQQAVKVSFDQTFILQLKTATDLLCEVSNSVASCLSEANVAASAFTAFANEKVLLERRCAGAAVTEQQNRKAQKDTRVVLLQLNELATELQNLHESNRQMESAFKAEVSALKAESARWESNARSLAVEIQSIRDVSNEQLRAQEAFTLADQSLRESIAMDSLRLREELAALTKQNSDMKKQMDEIHFRNETQVFSKNQHRAVHQQLAQQFLWTDLTAFSDRILTFECFDCRRRGRGLASSHRIVS